MDTDVNADIQNLFYRKSKKPSVNQAFLNIINKVFKKLFFQQEGQCCCL